MLAHGAAGIDDFLCATLHFGVGTLHRGKVQLGGIAAHAHAGGCTTAQTDAHAWSPQLHHQGAGRQGAFGLVAGIHRAHATGDHDGFVVAPAGECGDVAALGSSGGLAGLRTARRGVCAGRPFRPCSARLCAARLCSACRGCAAGSGMFRLQRCFEGPEIAQQVRPAEFIVEGGAAQRPLDHDGEWRGQGGRTAVGGLPGLFPAGNAQVRDGEAGQAVARGAAAAGGALVTDLAAASGGRARVRGDGRGVIVRLDLQQPVHRGIGPAVLAGDRIGGPALLRAAFENGSIVGVRHHGALWMGLVGVADQAEQGFFLRLAVDDEIGVEDLVAAVLGVGLREHHQLDIGRVAAQFAVGAGQIVDLVGRQGQTQPGVGGPQCSTGVIAQGHRGQWHGRVFGKELRRVRCFGEPALGHRVVQAGGQLREAVGRIILRPAAPQQAMPEAQLVADAALDACHAAKARMVQDVDGLG